MGPRMHSRSDSMSTPVQILETELLDLVELALQAQQTKWSLVPDVRGESTQMLTEVVAGVWARADRVAQALRAHGTPPDARIQITAIPTRRRKINIEKAAAQPNRNVPLGPNAAL